MNQVSVPEISFNRIVVDWNPRQYCDGLFTLSVKQTKTLYSAKVRAEDYREFHRSYWQMGKELREYMGSKSGWFSLYCSAGQSR